MISVDFDFQIVVHKPQLTRGFSKTDRQRLGKTGDFKYTPPKTISPNLANSSILANLPEEEADGLTIVQKSLKALDAQLDSFNKIIDQRCGHITVSYGLNDPEDESIKESCSKIFGFTNGSITYEMYVKAVAYLQKLDRLLAQKAIENEGLV